MDTRKVKIGFSIGLAAMAVVHAVALVGMLVVVDYHQTFEPMQQRPAPEPDWSIKNLGTPRTGMGAEPYQAPAKVNLDAQSELKGKLKGQCGPQGCNPVNSSVYSTVNPYSGGAVYLRPSGPRVINVPASGPLIPGQRDIDGHVIVSVGGSGQATRNLEEDHNPPARLTPSNPNSLSNNPNRPRPTPPRPTPRPEPTPPPFNPDPDLVIPVNNLPPKKEIEVAVFLNSSQKSYQVESWFESDRDLVSLRDAADFQIYRAGDPVYKARFGTAVAEKDFPVVIVQANDGGHIHAAGGNMMPSSAAQLFADISKGFKYYKQVKNSNVENSVETSGLIRNSDLGYSWDEDIIPELRLQDCDGPNCPTDSLRPSGRVGPLDRLFNRDRDNAEALVWVNATEIATVGCLCLAFVLFIVIIIKRFK